MRLINKTPVKTKGLRAILYDYAARACISTRGVIVEIREASLVMHGCCDFCNKKIVLWIFPNSRSQDIGFSWVHELQHLTTENKQLGSIGYEAQRDADRKAEVITGINKADVIWRLG